MTTISRILTRGALIPRYVQRCSFSRIAISNRPKSLLTKNQAAVVSTTRPMPQIVNQASTDRSKVLKPRSPRDDPQRQRSDRDIQRRGPVEERNPAGYARHHRRNGQTGQQRQHRGLWREVHIREGDAGSIRPDSEKRGLTEGEDAGIAPKDIHRQRRCGVEERPHKDVDGVGIEEIRPRDDRHYAQPRDRPSRHEPSGKGPPGQSRGRGGEVTHGRPPRAECAGGGLPEPRWSVRRSLD